MCAWYLIDRKFAQLVFTVCHHVVGTCSVWCVSAQADYYALGNRSHAYTVIAPAVAQYVMFHDLWCSLPLCVVVFLYGFVV